MNFIYVIHLLYWNLLTDLIIHNRSNRSNRNNSGNKDNKRGRALRARPLLLFEFLLLFWYSFLKAIRWFQYGKWMT